MTRPITKAFKAKNLALMIFILGAISCAKLPQTDKKSETQKPSPILKTKKEGNVVSVSPKNPDEKQLQEPKKEIKILKVGNKKKELYPHPKETIRKKRTRPKLSRKLRKYCRKIDKTFIRWGWGKSKCREFDWMHVRNSVKGTPLIWKVFGDEQEHKKKNQNMTLILCGVHGDEITPIKFCFDIIYHLRDYQEEFKDKLVAIAPIVNPDSFFKRRPTRTNYRGVDINRNFPTKDWRRDALKLWRGRYRKDKRRYPGRRPLSEPEVLFQVNLIKRYKPHKIISVHAPLTIIDYDGPQALRKAGAELLIQMSQDASGYRIKNYPFFPGSLGNWAGNERHIPTYTLELPSSDNRKHRQYWNLFKTAIHKAILHDLVDQEEETNHIALKKKKKDKLSLPQ